MTNIEQISILNKKIKEIKSNLDEAICLYSNCTIDARTLEFKLWDLHYEINGLFNGNPETFRSNPNLSQKHKSLYNEVFKYINHYDRLITPKPSTEGEEKFEI